MTHSQPDAFRPNRLLGLSSDGIAMLLGFVSIAAALAGIAAMLYVNIDRTETLETNLRSDIQRLETNLRSEIRRVEEDLRSEIRRVEEDLRSEIEENRAAIAENRTAIAENRTAIAENRAAIAENRRILQTQHVENQRRITRIETLYDWMMPDAEGDSSPD